jgi:hypothetical protein
MTGKPRLLGIGTGFPVAATHTKKRAFAVHAPSRPKRKKTTMEIPSLQNLPMMPDQYGGAGQPPQLPPNMPQEGNVEAWINQTLEKYGLSIDDGQLKGNFSNAGAAGQDLFSGLDSFYKQGDAKGEGGFSLESLMADIEKYSQEAAQTQGPERPTGPTGRPEGDDRSAEEIIADSPVLANLGDQKDIQRDKLKERCGDWTEDNPDPEARADAAYNMSQVLEYIDSADNREGGSRGPGDGDIQGITSSGDARHGTEAGMLKDFGDKGYEALPENHQLDQTNDKYVELDGSNKDNFEKFMDDVGDTFGPLFDVFSFIPGVNMLSNGIESFGSEGKYSTSNDNPYGQGLTTPLGIPVPVIG